MSDVRQDSSLAKVYSPADVESKWYSHWEKSGFFRAAVNPDKQSSAIVIHPPNITGVLHMGHILNNALQDALIRYKRMTGYEASWFSTKPTMPESPHKMSLKSHWEKNVRTAMTLAERNSSSSCGTGESNTVA